MGDNNTDSRSNVGRNGKVDGPTRRPASSMSLPVVNVDEEFAEIGFLIAQGFEKDAKGALEDLAGRGGLAVTDHPQYAKLKSQLFPIAGKATDNKAESETDHTEHHESTSQTSQTRPAPSAPGADQTAKATKPEATAKTKEASKTEPKESHQSSTKHPKERKNNSDTPSHEPKSRRHIPETSPLGRRLAALKKASAPKIAIKKHSEQEGAVPSREHKESSSGRLRTTRPSGDAKTPTGQTEREHKPEPLPPPPVVDEPDFDIDATDVAFPMERNKMQAPSAGPDFLGIPDNMSPDETSTSQPRSNEDEEPTAVLDVQEPMTGLTDEEPTRQRTPSVPAVPGLPLTPPEPEDMEPTGMSGDEEPTRQRTPSVPPVPGLPLTPPEPGIEKTTDDVEIAPGPQSRPALPVQAPPQEPMAPGTPPLREADGEQQKPETATGMAFADVTDPIRHTQPRKRWILGGSIGAVAAFVLIVIAFAMPNHKKDAGDEHDSDHARQDTKTKPVPKAADHDARGPAGSNAEPSRTPEKAPLSTGREASTANEPDASVPRKNSVQVTVTVLPKDAKPTISLLGKKQQGHSFADVFSVPPTKKALLEVSAPGFETFSKQLVLSDDIEEHVLLKQKVEQPRRPRHRRTRRGRKSHSNTTAHKTKRPRRVKKPRKPRSRLIGLD